MMKLLLEVKYHIKIIEIHGDMLNYDNVNEFIIWMKKEVAIRGSGKYVLSYKDLLVSLEVEKH